MITTKAYQTRKSLTLTELIHIMNKMITHAYVMQVYYYKLLLGEFKCSACLGRSLVYWHCRSCYLYKPREALQRGWKKCKKESMLPCSLVYLESHSCCFRTCCCLQYCLCCLLGCVRRSADSIPNEFYRQVGYPTKPNQWCLTYHGRSVISEDVESLEFRTGAAISLWNLWQPASLL